MVIENIKDKYEQLSFELKDALSKMELTDKITVIRNEIKDLQSMCPHSTDKYDYSKTDECPYCGKKFKG